MKKTTKKPMTKESKKKVGRAIIMDELEKVYGGLLSRGAPDTKSRF